MSGSFINGIGVYIPSKIIDNDYLATLVDTNDEWIVSRTGISRRRMVAEGELTSDLGTAAAIAALENAGRTVNEVTHLIVSTVTPDTVCPNTACIILNKLGIKGIMALDINAACSGFVYALQLADSIVKSEPAALVLIVSAETMTASCDWNDRATCVLFGDGAAAVLVSNTAPSTPSGFTAKLADIIIDSDGTHSEQLTMYGGGTRSYYKVGDAVARTFFVEMEGPEVYKHAVRSMTNACKDILERNNLTVDDISLMIPHQANQRILEAVAIRLRLPPEKLFSNVADYGNTSSASIAIAIEEAYKKGLLHKGDKVLLSTFGAGYTWTSAILDIL